MSVSNTVSRLLLPALLLSASAASAQTPTTYRLGLRAGLNRANVTLQGPERSVYPTYTTEQHKSALLGGQLGVVLEAARGPLALQTGLLFSQKGTVIHGFLSTPSPDRPQYNLYRDGRTQARYHWLELPLNVVYSPGRSGLQLFAGPYVAVGVGGKAATVIHNSSDDPNQLVVPTTRFTDKIEYGPGEPDNGTISIRGYYSRRFDAGFNAGIGYRRGPVQVQLGYGLGLVNLYQLEGTEQPSIQGGYNRGAQLTGTYFFGQ
ncbi:outer membrane beta-barrel protein [Hymenobacter jeollabukensis]|uniref:PorT family protein n=1 Tax=Hymenobacter jeollabukensis TaxID=2025313 RepID=A0A5R8WUU7_9BACT|nr:outer membrane beta-barrel protein [Hymenobacter jeollabukensis]TLM95216.1 PorT family protein [Hymenobacter jeollabukensis]